MKSAIFEIIQLKIMNRSLLILAATMFALSSNLFSQEKAPEKFDVQGHRGCRGLYPENSIPGFLHALDLGVTTLEMDVVITKDEQVVLSHEPFISRQICLGLDGKEISEAEEEKLNIYEMNYDDIKEYDCGSKPHPYFPEQKKMKVYKPLLSEVIEVVEEYVDANGLAPVYYNIETKTTPEGDDVFHPAPEEFVNLLIDVIQQYAIDDRVIIQSFDVRTLQAVKQYYPEYKLALLVGGEQDINKQLGELGFTPEIISPHFSHLLKGVKLEIENKDIEFIPWTVNEVDDMKDLFENEIKAIITDYPDRLLDVIND